MKLREIATKHDNMLLDIIESASGGGTSAGNVASVAQPMGTISRQPSLFGYIPEPETTKPVRKRRLKTK